MALRMDCQFILNKKAGGFMHSCDAQWPESSTCRIISEHYNNVRRVLISSHFMFAASLVSYY